MSTPYLSEIRIFSFGFAPRGWALCNGQSLPINQNQALFSLLGTTYGGNGVTAFSLPELRSRVPISFAAGFVLGQAGGEASHGLSIAELPAHRHSLTSSNDLPVNNVTSPANNYLAATADNSQLYYRGAADGALNAGVISNVGGGQPHENRQPFLVLNICIALQGIYPSQS